MYPSLHILLVYEEITNYTNIYLDCNQKSLWRIVSFDVCSLFPNIPMVKTTDIAVNIILENNVGIKIVSFDVCSLFTNIPLVKTTDIAVNVFLENNVGIKIVSFHVCTLFTSIPLEETIYTAVNVILENNVGIKIVSFHVCNLFTSIPLEETIDKAVNVILENNVGIKITKKELKHLFIYATSKTHFLFNGSIYDQIAGVAMGSPLVLVLVNLLMGHYEHKWIQGYSGIGPGHYRRYVDEIFALFQTEEQADLFFSYLKKRHPNISFTIEKEENGKLPFLDVLLYRGIFQFSSMIFVVNHKLGSSW